MNPTSLSARPRPAPADRATAARSAWPSILVITGAGIVSACQVGKMPVALDVLQAELSIGLDTVSWLMSVFALVGAVFGIATGTAVDRIGARRLVIAGLAVQGVAVAASALTASLAWLPALRCIEGAGFLAVVVGAPALIPQCVPERLMPRAFAVWSTFMPVGMTLASLGGGLIEHVGWRGFWWINAALLVAYALLFAVAVASGGRAVGGALTVAGLRVDVARTITARGPLLLAALFALFTACWFAVFSFLPSALGQRWALGAATAGGLVGVCVLAGAAGNLIGGHLLARGARPVRVLAAAFLGLSASSVGVFAEGASLIQVIALCLVFSTVGGVIPPVLFSQANIQAPAPALVGTTMGWLIQGNNAGLLAGPVAAAALAAGRGWPAVSLACAATAVVGALVALALPRR
ncbi:MFS transporter [Chitiniphilus purpureus]|uniref:MFS transporter n=1 Tax=Chitiniphilus purpureus TaxID=2981137 RepID=A0ABY6DMC2_9NEIS|nr:MFS transporter [Chitiniphilus sp. CD1]UXY15496.1 MFS transporter [Chitiniphilus sp. CD1]